MDNKRIDMYESRFMSVEILAVQYFLQHGNQHGIMIGKTQVQNILQKSVRLSFKKNMY